MLRFPVIREKIVVSTYMMNSTTSQVDRNGAAQRLIGNLPAGIRILFTSNFRPEATLSFTM